MAVLFPSALIGHHRCTQNKSQSPYKDRGCPISLSCLSSCHPRPALLLLCYTSSLFRSRLNVPGVLQTKGLCPCISFPSVHSSRMLFLLLSSWLTPSSLCSKVTFSLTLSPGPFTRHTQSSSPVLFAFAITSSLYYTLSNSFLFLCSISNVPWVVPRN